MLLSATVALSRKTNALEGHHVPQSLPPGPVDRNRLAMVSSVVLGFLGSLRRTFPCSRADDKFEAKRQSSAFFHASLLEFSSVVYDRMSARTGGHDGEASVWEVGLWSVQRFDMRVQSVDGFGNSVALSEGKFQATKLLASGSLLRTQFKGGAHGRSRFIFGLQEKLHLDTNRAASEDGHLHGSDLHGAAWRSQPRLSG